jgi:hypothetical protein
MRMIPMLMLLVLPLAAQEETKDCDGKCKPVPAAGKDEIRLEADGTKSVERRKRGSDINKQMTVTLTKVNLYRYKYNCTAQRYPNDEGTIATFLGLLGIQTGGGLTGLAGGDCADEFKFTMDELKGKVQPLVDKLNALAKKIDGAVKQNNEIAAKHKAFLDASQGETLENGELAKLYVDAKALEKMIEAYSTGTLANEAAALEAEVTATRAGIKGSLETFDFEAFNKAQADAVKELAEKEAEQKGLKAAGEKLKAQLAEIRAAQETLEAKVVALEAELKTLEATPVPGAAAEKKKREAAIAAKKGELDAAKKGIEGEKAKLAAKNTEVMSNTSEIEKVDGRITQLKAAPGCKQALAELLKLAAQDSKALVERAKELTAAAKGLADSEKKLKEFAARIREVHKKDSLNMVSCAFPTGDEGETDKLCVHFTDTRTKDARPQEVGCVLLIGTPNRFSMSGGVGFTTVGDRAVIKRTSRGATDTATPVETFDYSADGWALRPAIGVFLNGHLRKFNLFGERDATFAVSTGVVGANRNDSTQLEYVVGPSLGLLKNQMFLTFGLHMARTQELAGGFQIGAHVPQGLGEPPVKKHWSPGFMFSISYAFYGSGRSAEAPRQQNTAGSGGTATQ